MSTFSNTPNLPTPSSATATNTAVTKSAPAAPAGGPATILNAGAISTILSTANSQLTLATATGKISIPATKITSALDTGKDVAIKVNSEKSTTLLEVAAKYSQQRISLNSQQSQQVLQTIVQNPGSLSGGVEVKGRVVAVQQNQIQVNVNGQTINLNVRNPQLYQKGQDIKLELSSGTLGWEVSVQNNKIKESLRLPPEDTHKLLKSLKPGNAIELSDTGKNFIKPVLKQNTESQLPEKLTRITLNNTDNKLTAKVEIGSNSIVKLPINEQTLQLLSKVDLRSNLSKGQFRENTLQSDINKILGQNPKGAGDVLNEQSDVKTDKRSASTGATRQAESHIYRHPISAKQAPSVEMPADLEKTIKTSQEQFAELNTTSKKPPAAPINEIRLGKHNNIEGTNAKPTETPETTQIKKEPEKPLSTSAQQILNTLKTLNAENPTEIKNTMLQNLSRILEASTQQSKAAPANVQSGEILKLIRQITEQTSGNSTPQPEKIFKAIEEVIESTAIDEGIKKHVKQAVNQIKPEQSGLPIPDMPGVKQLLQSPALPITATSLVTPAPSSGLVAGLINLLQVSLTAKLNKNNQQFQEKLSTSLAGIVASGVKAQTGAKPAGQGMRELSNIEQKHNLVKLLSDMVNQHTNQKVQNAERNLQGQEAMYYVLPFGQQEDQKPAELLIQRDKPEEQEKSEQKNQTSSWSLTMKLPIGELGEILTKSKVSEDKIELDLYTSSEELKNLTLNYLPLLKRRFDDLGLNLNIGRCERGNIPEQLAKNPYQILETRV